MAKKRAFISFDYDHDEGAKTMLAGQAKLTDSPFEFTDASVKEHLSGDWREKVRRRMDNIDVVIVLCGQHAYNASGVNAELQIAQQKGKDYFLLAAYSDKTCEKPGSALYSDKLYEWTWANLKALIGGSSGKSHEHGWQRAPCGPARQQFKRSLRRAFSRASS